MLASFCVCESGCMYVCEGKTFSCFLKFLWGSLACLFSLVTPWHTQESPTQASTIVAAACQNTLGDECSPSTESSCFLHHCNKRLIWLDRANCSLFDDQGHISKVCNNKNYTLANEAKIVDVILSQSQFHSFVNWLRTIPWPKVSLVQWKFMIKWTCPVLRWLQSNAIIATEQIWMGVRPPLAWMQSKQQSRKRVTTLGVDAVQTMLPRGHDQPP